MWSFRACREALTRCASSGIASGSSALTIALEGGAANSIAGARRGIKAMPPGSSAVGKLKPEPRGMEAPMTSFEAGAMQERWGSAGGGAAPWTPTSELKKRKTYFKRCGHIMETLERERMKELAQDRAVVPFRPGDVVKLTLEVPENMRKTQTFTGICIAKRHRGLGSSFTLRSAVGNLVVERSFPLFTPNIKAMEILERRKVRRAKLYYLRDKPLRFSRP